MVFETLRVRWALEGLAFLVFVFYWTCLGYALFVHLPSVFGG